jgi:hypothetical protein
VVPFVEREVGTSGTAVMDGASASSHERWRRQQIAAIRNKNRKRKK